MHAFLLVNQGLSADEQIESLGKRLHAKILEFSIQKIEDVRNLNNLVRLSFEEPTLIVSKNINEATEEALNAFLKNLEEPQENIFFVLTTPSIRKILPTVLSRCQILTPKSNKIAVPVNEEEIETFFKMNKSQKFAYVDTIKDRDKSIEFTENMALFLHGKLHSNQVKYTSLAKEIEIVTETIKRLRANGNVNLQLTNMVIHL